MRRFYTLLLSFLGLFVVFSASGCLNLSNLQDIKGIFGQSSSNVNTTNQSSQSISYSQTKGVISSPNGEFTFEFPIKVKLDMSNLDQSLDPNEMKTFLLAKLYIENNFLQSPVFFGALVTGINVNAFVKGGAAIRGWLKPTEVRTIDYAVSVSQLLPTQSVNYYFLFAEPFSFTILPDGKFNNEIAYDIKLANIKIDNNYYYLTFQVSNTPSYLVINVNNINRCMPYNNVYSLTQMFSQNDVISYLVQADKEFTIICEVKDTSKPMKITGAVSFKVLLGSQLINCEDCETKDITTYGKAYLDYFLEDATKKEGLMVGAKYGQLSGLLIYDYSYNNGQIEVTLFNPYNKDLLIDGTQIEVYDSSGKSVCSQTLSNSGNILAYGTKEISISCSLTNGNQYKLCVTYNNAYLNIKGENCISFTA